MRNHKTILISLIAFGILSAGCSLDSDDNDGQLNAFLRSLLEDPETVGKTLTNPLYDNLEMFIPTTNAWALQEHPADQVYAPDRGDLWDDNQDWRDLHTHTWNTQHPFIGNAWNSIVGGIATAISNQTLVARAGEAPQLNPLKAELSALRALYIASAVDLFGQVVLIDGLNVIVLSRSEGTELAIQDLEDALDFLPEKSDLEGVETISRMTKASAHALLARLHLNKHIYQDSGNPITPDLLQVVSSCSAIIESGQYALDNDYWNIFSTTNNMHTSSVDEVILGVRSFGGRNASPQILTRLFLHPSHFNTTNTFGYNAFAILPEAFFRWDQSDTRFAGPAFPNLSLNLGFMEGPQFTSAGDPLLELDSMTQVDYGLDCPLTDATNSCGVRAVKYAPDTTGMFPEDSHFALIRLAEVYLMKAEAEYYLGSQAEALNSINTLREVRGNAPLGEINEDVLLDEYGFELWLEGHRRTTQIRFGTFLLPVMFRETMTDPARLLFPIPQFALNQVPELVQNPGY